MNIKIMYKCSTQHYFIGWKLNTLKKYTLATSNALWYSLMMICYVAMNKILSWKTLKN